ncbi:unnamed protein product [Camellia sinensis]
MDTQPSKAPEVVTIDVHAAKLLITSGHRFLDVRTEEEFKKGHVDVENALNIPYMFNNPEGRVKNPKFMEQVLSVCKPDDHLVVGCQSGVRSVYATTDLLKAEIKEQFVVQWELQDFKNVCNMGGGYLAWVENGFAVTKPSEEKKVVENGSAVTDPSEEEKVVENGFSVTKPSEEKMGGMTKVIVKADATQVIKLLEDGLSGDCPFQGLIEDARIIMRGCECTIQHVLREGNSCADAMAKFGAKQPMELLVVNDHPAEVHSLLWLIC